MKAAQGVSDPSVTAPSSSNPEDRTKEDADSTVTESNSTSSMEQLYADADGDNVPLKNLDEEVIEEIKVDRVSIKMNHKRTCWRRRMKLVLLRSSFFLVGLVILVTGGVCSRFLRPYVDPEEYLNCSSDSVSSVNTSQWIGSAFGTHTPPATTPL